MKRIILLIAAALSLFSSVAFAADVTIATASVTAYTIPTDGTASFLATNVGAGVTFQVKPSANVGVGLASDGSTYVTGSYHSSGTKSYATSSVDAKLYMQENTAQTSPAYPVSITAAKAGTWTGWTAVK